MSLLLNEILFILFLLLKTASVSHPEKKTSSARSSVWGFVLCEIIEQSPESRGGDWEQGFDLDAGLACTCGANSQLPPFLFSTS